MFKTSPGLESLALSRFGRWCFLSPAREDYLRRAHLLVYQASDEVVRWKHRLTIRLCRFSSVSLVKINKIKQVFGFENLNPKGLAESFERGQSVLTNWLISFNLIKVERPAGIYKQTAETALLNSRKSRM